MPMLGAETIGLCPKGIFHFQKIDQVAGAHAQPLRCAADLSGKMFQRIEDDAGSRPESLISTADSQRKIWRRIVLDRFAQLQPKTLSQTFQRFGFVLVLGTAF